MLCNNSFFLKNFFFFDKSLFLVFNFFYKNNFFNFFHKNNFFNFFYKNNFYFYKYINSFFLITSCYFDNSYNLNKFCNYNLNKFNKIYKYDTTYIFLINVNIYIKIYKNIINILYLNFYNNKLCAFLNVSDLFYEVNMMNYTLFNYNFLNIFNRLLSMFSKKKIARNYLLVFLNKLFKKYKIFSLVVVDNLYSSHYRSVLININLPIISFALPNMYNNNIDYPIFISNITLFHKYFFLCEVYNIYFIARFNWLKSQLLLYFYHSRILIS